jgi:hypothetical protein
MIFMRRSVIICGLFLLALGVRFLTLQDNHREVRKVQTIVTENCKRSAYYLVAGDLKSFTGDINQLGHPTGSPIFLA